MFCAWRAWKTNNASAYEERYKFSRDGSTPCATLQQDYANKSCCLWAVNGSANLSPIYPTLQRPSKQNPISNPSNTRLCRASAALMFPTAPWREQLYVLGCSVPAEQRKYGTSYEVSNKPCQIPSLQISLVREWPESEILLPSNAARISHIDQQWRRHICDGWCDVYMAYLLYTQPVKLLAVTQHTDLGILERNFMKISPNFPGQPAQPAPCMLWQLRHWGSITRQAIGQAQFSVRHVPTACSRGRCSSAPQPTRLNREVNKARNVLWSTLLSHEGKKHYSQTVRVFYL